MALVDRVDSHFIRGSVLNDSLLGSEYVLWVWYILQTSDHQPVCEEHSAKKRKDATDRGGKFLLFVEGESDWIAIPVNVFAKRLACFLCHNIVQLINKIERAMSQ